MPDAASNETALPVDEAAFRSLMGQFATGVCVVSTQQDGDAPAGITVNSFVSVSLEPMLVCWSLHNSASQYDVWTQADGYSISILAEDQGDIAREFASRDAYQAGAEHFARGSSGLPHIAGALGYLECRPWKLYPAGDHTMILGEVTGLYLADGAEGSAGRPLLFYGSAFREIAAK
ncbi:MAG: flavin reductase family protein [Pseudomonadota bacterium]